MKLGRSCGCAVLVALCLCTVSRGLAQGLITSGSAEHTASAAHPAAAMGPIETDRPGNGNAATTVPQWRLQIETSVNYAFVQVDAEAPHQLSLPTALRFGVLPFLELRLGSSLLGIQSAPPPGEHPVSATDMFVGTKARLLRNHGWTPNLALMVDVYLPVGSDPFTAGVVVPEARAAASWTLPRGLGVLLNAGLDVPENSTDERFVRILYVANLGYTLPCLDQRLSVFIESFGLVPVANRSDLVVQVDVGAALLLNDNLQLDLFTQQGLSSAATDFQVALGFSARFRG